MAAKSLFRKLSPAVYLAEPASSLVNGAAAGAAAKKAPELILISGWMGVRPVLLSSHPSDADLRTSSSSSLLAQPPPSQAQLKHVEKYAETYRTIVREPPD